MTTFTLKNALMATMLIAGAALMTGCGSSGAQSSSDFASRGVISSVSESDKKALAVCNQTTGSDLAARQMAYTEGSSYRMDLVWVKLTTLPSDFASGTSYISMWKWLANSNGSTYLDSTAVPVALYDTQTKKFITNWGTSIKWTEISSMALAMGYSSPTSFFGRVTILANLKDTNGEYDALKISVYSTSTNKAINEINGLLPLFSANPNAYAVESSGAARATVLQKLHPFYTYKSAGYTTAQFQSMAQNYCF
ncbi:hypothetical protein B9G69_003085 [Bdellovibrio sp. SKB1291214]|uniref:hypothetical protein n=1 Tax=Bdellovibrio sp. SKB1291214 TaxID=1732569 RepID=UPI0020CB8798|nr:hypothetical protein [Bdellovibrio sp. SKB1291214]UYL09555.1 hypothetical protein B9G69_003085 [Bdellovibrio sp. SKB1291214]